MKKSFKNKFKTFLFDLRNIKEWPLIYKIRTYIFYIKDYERLSYDYRCVLCHATNGKMSKTNYVLNDIYLQIDESQRETWEYIFKEDISDIIYSESTNEDIIKEIKKYHNIEGKE